MSTWRTQVRVTYPGGGSPGFNTWHYRAPDSDDDPSIGNTRLEDFYDAIKASYPNTATISSDGIWTGVLGAQGERVDLPGWSLAGTGSANMLPPIANVGLVLRTSVASGRGRGRVFLGPLEVGAVGGSGDVGAGTRSLIVGAAEEALLTGLPGGGSFVVYSRAAGLVRDVVSFSVPADFWSLTTRRD